MTEKTREQWRKERDPKTPIHSREFFQMLVEAGLFEDGDRIRRVVIDCQVGEAVKLYIERYAEQAWLNAGVMAGLEVTPGEEYDRGTGTWKPVE